MKRTIVFILLAASWCFAETQPAGKTLKDALQPARKSGGLAMPGQFIWCSSVIKVGDTYHMFASRWPDTPKGIGAWTSMSECVRATSRDLLGPYEFQEVVLQKRPDNWDNTRVHNVKIVKAGDQYVLYYIDTANETGYAVADAVTGPWKRSDKPVMKVSNPAILVRPDNSIYVFGRLKVGDVNRGIGFTAPSYQGPYALLEDGRNLLPNDAELEDPCIWWASNQYNVVLNDWKGKATGTVKAGAQYFSRDGVKWELMSREPVFTKKVDYDDGTSETFSRRERPFVYVNEKGEALALFTACLPEKGPARVVVQPIDRYVPANP